LVLITQVHELRSLVDGLCKSVWCLWWENLGRCRAGNLL